MVDIIFLIIIGLWLGCMIYFGIIKGGFSKMAEWQQEVCSEVVEEKPKQIEVRITVVKEKNGM